MSNRKQLQEAPSVPCPHQLACTASMSPTRFWARQIPKIWTERGGGVRGEGGRGGSVREKRWEYRRWGEKMGGVTGERGGVRKKR